MIASTECGGRSRALLWVGACALLSGCFGVAFLQDLMARRFVAEFACESPEAFTVPQATRLGDRLIRVEGCDVVAFYYCDQNSCRLEHSRAPTKQERSAAAERARAAAVEHERLDAAQHVPTDVEIQRAAENRRADEAEFRGARQALATQPDKLRALGAVESDDWRIEVVGLPESPALVLWRFHSQRGLSAAPCRPTLSRDGRLLSTEPIESHAPHDADFLIKAADYHSLAQAQQLRGVICGVDFALDAAALTKLVPAASPTSPQ